MTARPTCIVRIAAGSVAAALVMCTVSLVGAGNAAASPDPTIAADNPSAPPLQGSRVGGADRYATAAQVAEQLASNGKDISTFVLASGDERSDGVDALSANYLAGVLAKKSGAPVPVLLTKQGELPGATTQALSVVLGARKDKLAKVSVYVVGGTSAVSQAVVDGVPSALSASVANAVDVSITRIGGADRYATAAAVATQPGAAAVGAYVARFGEQPGRTVFLSNGLTPADALSAGPVAYRNNFPVLLSRPGSIPAAAVKAMTDDQVRNVILLGGTTAVSDAVPTQLKNLGFTVTRVAGADRYATNTALYGFSNRAAGGTAGDVEGGLGYPSPSTALLANGVGFADALTAGPLAAEGLPGGDDQPPVDANSPLLLTSPAGLSAATAQYLTDNQANIDIVTGVGLDTALPASVLAAANNAAQGSAATQAARQACLAWKVADGQSAAEGSGTRRQAAQTARAAASEYAQLSTDMGFVSSLPETGNSQANVDKARAAVARIVTTCQVLGVPGIKQA